MDKVIVEVHYPEQAPTRVIHSRDSASRGFLSLIFVPLGWMFIAAVVVIAFVYQLVKSLVRYLIALWKAHHRKAMHRPVIPE